MFQDIGLNEHHQQNVVNYLRFARYGRGQRLRGVDASFEELKDSRYIYTEWKIINYFIINDNCHMYNKVLFMFQVPTSRSNKTLAHF